MIISCIKCNKKFSVDDKLIPELGRILECGSCSHQWHYIPILLINKNIDTKKNEDIIKNNEPIIFDKKTNINKIIDKKNIPSVEDNNSKNSIPNLENNNNKVEPVIKKKLNFLSNLLVIIITFIGVIIILDTFRDELSSTFPSLDLYLYSLYNVVTDIFLFITNLIT
jgi:predicted Zn finger-like uncharacterized protein